MTQTLPLDLVFFAFFVFLKHQLVNPNELLEIQSLLTDGNKWRQVSGVLWTALKEANCLLFSHVQRDACRGETRPCSLELDLPFRRRAGALETFHVPAWSQPFLLGCLRTLQKAFWPWQSPQGTSRGADQKRPNVPPGVQGMWLLYLGVLQNENPPFKPEQY